jgi:hypothetical protein
LSELAGVPKARKRIEATGRGALKGIVGGGSIVAVARGVEGRVGVRLGKLENTGSFATRVTMGLPVFVSTAIVGFTVVKPGIVTGKVKPFEGLMATGVPLEGEA